MMPTILFANILEACRNGDLEVLKSAARQGVSLTAENHRVVREAAQRGQLAVVRWLIEESGQLVDATAQNNFAIQLAAQSGHLAVIKYLIEESGQAVDATASNNSAVQVALQNGYLELAKYLVEDSGQPVDVTEENNWNALVSAQNGRLGALRYLIEEASQSARRNPAWTGKEVPQVDITARDNWAVEMAIEEGQRDTIDYLIEDSGQLQRMLLCNTTWLPKLQQSELERVAIVGYGVDPRPFFQRTDLLDALLQQPPLTDAAPLTKLLIKNGVSSFDRTAYYLSAACRAAAATGFITSRVELDAFLATAGQQTPNAQRRL